MPNLRIIYDNAAERATLSSTTSLVASMPITNLVNTTKSRVCRSTTTSLRIAAVWPTAELVSGIALPFCNLSPTATARIRITNEAGATNFMLQSSVQSNASYTKSATTVGSAVVAPDGTTTALPVIDTAATSAHTISQSISLGSTATYTFSLFIKANGRTRAKLSNATLGAFANLDLTAGTVLTTGGTGYVGSSIKAYPNSWYRVSLTFTTGVGSSQALTLGLQDAAGTDSYLGNASSGVVSWGWQLETGLVATSHIPTTTTTAARVAGYIDTWQSYAYDSGNILCCPAPSVSIRGWTLAQSVSAYAYGGGTHARAWLTQTSALGLVIDIADPSNAQGYAEVSKLVIGDYWEPKGVGAEIGATMTVEDSSKHTRTDAGDLITDVGTRFRKQELSLPDLNPVDRAKMWDILWGNGMSRPIFLSTYPNSSDLKLEQAHQLYGKLVQTPVMGTPYFNSMSANIEIEEI